MNRSLETLRYCAISPHFSSWESGGTWGEVDGAGSMQNISLRE